MRYGNFQRTMMFLLFSGIIGSYVAGEIGALIGCLLGVGLGIIVWHRHNWQRQALYDTQGKPVLMLKICECGEIEFDGWFKVGKVVEQ